MSKRERQRSFAAAAAVVVVALVSMSALGASDDKKRSGPRASTAAHVESTPPGPRRPAQAPGYEAEDRSAATADAPATRAPAGAERDARRFVSAFARYQTGRLDGATVTALRALATPQLARYLLAQPPRRGRRSQARLRIGRLDLVGSGNGQVKTAALLAYGDRRRSLFEFALQRDGRGWRVTELYPSAG